MDASAKMIDMSTDVVKDGGAAAAIMGAIDMTDLGHAANAWNGAMKGNEDDAAAAVKSPATIDAVVTHAPLFAKPYGTAS